MSCTKHGMTVCEPCAFDRGVLAERQRVQQDQQGAQSGKKPRCFVCEKVTTGFLQIKEDGAIRLVVCYECIGIGIRWIVKQAREDFEKDEPDSTG